MSKIKILSGVVIGVIAVIVIAFLVLFSNLDSLVRKTIEMAGSKVTGVDVTLKNVELDLTEGQAVLSGFTVGNPAGFQTDHAISVRRVEVVLDTSALSQDLITIRKVDVQAPEVVYELGGKGSNIETIQKHVEQFTAAQGSGSASASGNGEAQSPKVIIDNLYVRDGGVAVSAAFLKGKELGVPLPDIHLSDIGRESGGASPADAAAEIISAINSKIGGAISRLDFSSLKNAGKNVGDAVGGAAKGAAGALKGLLDGGAN